MELKEIEVSIVLLGMGEPAISQLHHYELAENKPAKSIIAPKQSSIKLGSFHWLLLPSVLASFRVSAPKL